MSRSFVSYSFDSHQSVEAQTALGLLAMLKLPGVGPRAALRAALIAANYERLLDEHDARWTDAVESAQQDLDTCAQYGIAVLSIFDERYPERLRALHDPPALLYCLGSLDALADPRSVAVVGTREPTSFGCSATEQITKALADAKWSVISGLAKGIDTLAHGAALKYDTPTVAVMAGGLDRIYPAENKELAAAIVERGGALISEHGWGIQPRRSAFVQRNRIQSGLAAAVVATQTGAAGGTMHTVRHAASQGRPVFCPKPHTAHEKNEGLKILLSVPARDLCATLPAWKDSGALCVRLGNEPLAHPVAKDDLGSFIGQLELTLEGDELLHPQERWWAAEEQTPGPNGSAQAPGQPDLFASLRE
jgi:DNA processing protein